MKKIISLLFIGCLYASISFLYAQTNASVDIDDDVYLVLQNAELKGYVPVLKSSRPYTQKYIVECLNTILENLDEKENPEKFKTEREVVEYQLSRFNRQTGLEISKLHYRNEKDVLGIPVSLDVQDTFQGYYSAGFYDNSSLNSMSFEVWNTVDFSGDLGDHISYRNQTFLGGTQMPLTTKGSYDIGYWLSTKYNDVNSTDEDKIFASEKTQYDRTITTLRNYSHLPYSYKKFWDGSVYAFDGGINAGGLKPWPYKPSIAFGMNGEIRASFLNDIIEIGVGRNSREWGAMEQGASLVLNSNARPFFAFDTTLRPFKWISLRTMTGVLEMPNRSDVLKNAWYPIDENGKNTLETLHDKNRVNTDDYNDYQYFQNAFSIGEIDLDFKYLHLDVGSSCVWPKRFEMGYMFPLIDRVVYQNDVGDYDNLALFGSMKIRYPEFGHVWFSFYLDELNAFLTKFWKNTRAMYAFQVGTKMRMPVLPFSNLSIRFTQVEPYCYTHQALNSTPWYNHYISENYTNNGECLGYYLQPNSQELLIKYEVTPSAASLFNLQYQFITHGADFGSKAVPGSSIYSELPRRGRGDLRKNKFYDGAYELTHVLSFSGSYKFTNTKTPVQLFMTAGYVYDFFTSIEGESVSIYEHLKRYSVNEDYHYETSGEYAPSNGFVCTVGMKVFGR